MKLNIYFKPTNIKLFFIVLAIFIFFFATADVIHCDDGLIPVNESYYYEGLIPVNESHYYEGLIPANESNYNSGISHNVSSWQNHYQNSTLQESYPIIREGQPIYQAYNETLQLPSQGNRYELDVDNNRYEYGDDGTRYIKYGWTDSSDSSTHLPAYSTRNSTELGEIHPIPDEVLSREYHGVARPPLDVSKTTLSRKVYNKAKVVVKNRFAKYNEPSWQRQERVKSYNRQMLQDKLARNAAKDKLYYDRQRLQYEYYEKIAYARKVRRFD